MLPEIQATGVVLNAAWWDFAANSTDPKSCSSRSTKLLDVECCYLGPSHNGAPLTFAAVWERGAAGKTPNIRDMWRSYQTNGHNVTNAAWTVIPARIPSQPFDSIANW